MSIRGEYEFLFTGSDDNSFLENYAYDFHREHGEEGGQVFVNLEIQNNPLDAEEIGSVIFEMLQKIFFEDLSIDPYERFEAALKEINGVLAEFKSQKMSGYIGNLNVVIAAIVDNQLFLTQCGDAEAYLIRKRYVSIISEGLSEDASSSDEVFASIASGEIEQGDFVLFSSSRLVRYISKTDLAQCISKTSVVESLNEIQDVISTEILGRVALTGILFRKVASEEVAEIENEIDEATTAVLESGGGRYSAYTKKVKTKFSNLLKSSGGAKKGRRASVSDLREGVSSSFSGFFGFLKRGLFSGGFGKDKILSLLVIVIVVLLVGILFANFKQSKREELAELDAVLVEVRDRIAEAETRGVYDKDAARMILDRAYTDARTVLESGHYRDKAGLYLLKIEETRDRLDNVQRVSEPKVIADLSSKRTDISALGFALIRDRVFVYDSNGLYEIVLDQVQDPLTVSDDEIVVSATGFSERNSILFLTQRGNLLEYREGVMSLMSTEDGNFRRGVSLLSWGSRIYILDPVEGQIWRYSYRGLREIFGPAEPYVNDGTDISKAVDFAIDASVYVLEQAGGLMKFYAGSKQEFYVNNPPFAMFKSPDVVYTTDRLDQVFVLDSADARVLVYDKEEQTGNVRYSAQYVFDGVGSLRDIYVDPDSQKVYVLSESKVLELEK